MLPALVAAALTIVVAGCAGSDDATTSGTDSATTVAAATTEPATTTASTQTPEDAAAAQLCDAMESVGVSEFVGDEPSAYPDSFEPEVGQTSAMQCALNEGFRSVSVFVATHTDVAAATATFDARIQQVDGEPAAGLGDRAWVDTPADPKLDKSAVVQVLVGNRFVSISTISGPDDPPDRTALATFASAIIATL